MSFIWLCLSCPGPGLEEQDHGKIYPGPEQYTQGLLMSLSEGKPQSNLWALVRSPGLHTAGERGKDMFCAILSLISRERPANIVDSQWTEDVPQAGQAPFQALGSSGGEHWVGLPLPWRRPAALPLLWQP